MHKKKSIALILALFSMIFISLLAVAFLDIVGIDQQITTNYIRGLEAEFIADAGIETAVYELKSNSSWNGTGPAVVFPAGTNNTYNVTVSGSLIASKGTSGDFSRTIEAYYSQAGSTVAIVNWTWAN